MVKKIAIGSDHGGFGLKQVLKGYLERKGIKVSDYGAYSEDSSDYPVFGYRVAEAVSKKQFKRGIAICKTGIGMAVIANKLPGVRSGVCNTLAQARTSRLHNDTNVLSLAAKYIDAKKAKRIVNAWLGTGALAGRHRRRVNQIKRLEKKR